MQPCRGCVYYCEYSLTIYRGVLLMYLSSRFLKKMFYYCKRYFYHGCVWTAFEYCLDNMEESGNLKYLNLWQP